MARVNMDIQDNAHRSRVLQRELRKQKGAGVKLHCWWFGCEIHPQDPTPVEYVTCVNCGEIVSYSDMVGDTRHYRAADFLKRLIPRWPQIRCKQCGGYFGKHADADCDIPF